MRWTALVVRLVMFFYWRTLGDASARGCLAADLSVRLLVRVGGEFGCRVASGDHLRTFA
jgi:hypothetical protein